MSRHSSYRLTNTLVVILLRLGSVLMLAPLVWMISTSLKTMEGVFELPPQWLPVPFVWSNSARIWEAGPLLSGIRNSVIVSLTVTVVGTVTSSLAAFAFSKLRLPGTHG